ncbi:MAG TPA: hypothetical protein PLI70_09890 [Gemmatimonadales bacterium]|nr:hypothetical protein [Gemmatimonadales bacterium]HRZ10728.1 hypothetical protein [Gemmatimonadales bacterium]
MFVLPFLAALMISPSSAVIDPTTGADVIRMMQAKYEGKWYRTLTFVQATRHADGSVETWYEAMRIPGALRIDIAPLAAQSVMLFRNDSIYRYVGGETKLARSLVHPLLLLGFDVYGQPAEKTIATLTALGYDLSKVRSGSWQGRKVWIVGAAEGDTTTTQFWVDQERLVFVRSLATHPQKPGVITDVQFNKYVKLGKGWIETEVLFLENGVVTLTEEYRDMKADPVPALDPAIFEPGAYRAPGWVTE